MHGGFGLNVVSVLICACPRESVRMLYEPAKSYSEFLVVEGAGLRTATIRHGSRNDTGEDHRVTKRTR